MLRHILILALTTLPALALAGPERYRLDAARSTVAFTYAIEGNATTGRMPVKSAVITLDLDNMPASRVDVVLDATRARAGLVFATQAMKSKSVLDTARHPEIRFRSTRIAGDLLGASVTGDLTVRGVTRPVTLDAGLYRQRGTPARDRDNLMVLLTGSVSRAAFGAGGYQTFVDDRIGLRIIARITK